MLTRKFMTTAVDQDNRVGLAPHEVCEVLALSKGEVSLAERNGLAKLRIGLAEHFQQKCPHLQGQPLDVVLDSVVESMII
jgi:hypothetical protein